MNIVKTDINGDVMEYREQPPLRYKSGKSFVAGLDNETLYELLVNKNSEAVLLLNPELEILDTNDSFCRMTGYSYDELLSMKYEDLMNCGTARDINRVAGGNNGLEKQYICKDGHTIDVSVDIKKLDGYLLLFHKDITEQKRGPKLYFECEKKYRILFDNIPVPVVKVDYSEIKRRMDTLRSQGVVDFKQYFNDNPDILEHYQSLVKIIDINKAFIDLYDARDETGINDVKAGGVVGHSAKLGQTIWNKILFLLVNNIGRFKQETTIRTFKNRRKHIVFEYYLFPGFEDTWSRVIVAFTDITELKRAEKQLSRYKKSIEKVVNKRTFELIQANKQLEEQMQQRIQFSRALIHELKTPLTPMITTSELLSDMIKSRVPREMAETLYCGACALNKRIDELLDVARGEIGMLKLDLRMWNATKIIQEACQYMSSVFLSRGQEFRVEIPDHLPCIAVDKQRIREVLINLLDNSSKYTQEGGQIMLRVTENPDGISVEIEDNGLGISPEKKEKLFSLYNISSYKVGSTQGLGVGLALSRMFVEMHGGRIWGGDNPKGQGSIFGFYLPYKSVMP